MGLAAAKAAKARVANVFILARKVRDTVQRGKRNDRWGDNSPEACDLHLCCTQSVEMHLAWIIYCSDFRLGILGSRKNDSIRNHTLDIQAH